eukprot:scaffold3166_cov111-Isochrysis_galbana.AAC.1
MASSIVVVPALVAKSRLFHSSLVGANTSALIVRGWRGRRERRASSEWAWAGLCGRPQRKRMWRVRRHRYTPKSVSSASTTCRLASESHMATASRRLSSGG